MSNELPRAATADTDSLIGEVLANRYQIERRLGEGAMGVVYKARHVKMGRPFAVKVLHPRFLTDPKIAQRFEREAELAGKLRHPNVIGVVDVGETSNGFRYMVMDFVEGPDLATLLGEAPMPPQRIIHIVRQLLEGLYHAHEEGLIHRDFKPENVLVERDTHGAEVPRIVDFGISILAEGGDSPDSPGRLTTNGLVLGTPHYMAPEQAVADPVDHRIDLFALGIVIYEMLSGKLPFDGSGAEVARANLMLDPPRISKRVPYLDVDPLLEAFARKLMAKSRTSRPTTAKAARELLDLIDRDRAAAAAALGVPIELGTRPPVRTEPVTPTTPDQDETARVTPPQAPPMGAVVAVSEAVVSTPSVIVRPPTAPRPVVDGTAATALDSDHLSSSLLVERRGNRGLWIVSGVATLAIVGVAVAMIANRSNDRTPDPVPALPTTIASPEPPTIAASKPDPKPAPVDEPKPAPLDEPKPAAVDEPKPAEPKPAPVVAHPTPARPPTRPAVTHPRDPVTHPEVKPNETPRVVEQPTPTPPPVTPPPTPTMTPAQIEAAAKAATSAMYYRVGAEIAQLRKAKGNAIANQMNDQYRQVSIMTDVATPESRAKANKILDSVHQQITDAMK